MKAKSFFRSKLCASASLREKFRIRSFSLIGALLLAGVGLLGPQSFSEPKAVKEHLQLTKISAQGVRTAMGTVTHVYQRGDKDFENKLAFARAVGVTKESPLQRAIGYLSPSRAYALVVNAGETALRDCFGGTGTPTCTAIQAMKYHGIGTGATAAAEGDTTLQTELTTQYNPDSTRATGSQTNNGANIYRTVGTNTVDASAAITEWGLFSAASAGTMWSRVVFSAINLTSGDSLATTYDLTIE